MGILDRLKRRREFLIVASQGRKWAAAGLILQARPHQPADPDAAAAPAASRVGFTVSRKVGNAVARNRARRRLKAAAEAVMPTQARAAYDYVLIGRQQTMTRPFPALLQDLETALRKTGAHVSSKDNADGEKSRRA
ncbi:MAG TPA: ribonuclease P protein component [Alphaproteobacteria bacterium]|nr:ribonuclease P protein component [Alphaproteobacteria bacterium]